MSGLYHQTPEEMAKMLSMARRSRPTLPPRQRGQKREPGIYELGARLHGYGSGSLVAFDAEDICTIRGYEDDESYSQAYAELESWLVARGIDAAKLSSRPALFLM